MAFWLASEREGQASDWIMRFDPRFWTVNFPRPMMAAVVSTGPDALRVEAAFLRKCDLGGLIWDSEDRLDHPLLAYRTDRDYAHTALRFRWRSGGIAPLDAVNGPTLTVEGRDAAGAPRTWYVRLWNYAEGTGEDALVSLDFSQLDGGFLLPAEADRVWPSAIERMFISFAPPGYDAESDEPLPAEAEGWIEVSAIAADGARAMLEIGDVLVQAHGLGIATGFDDQGVQTPARLLRAARQLGYRGSVIHYIGMSHYFRLAAMDGAFLAGGPGATLNAPTRVWHRAFFAECLRLGFSPVASLSYELLDQHCPAAWKQRAHDGAPALTGWDPPSTLLSPASGEAMDWLRAVAGEMATLMAEAGAPVRFQVGEPWWWTFADGRICLYDAAAQAALGGAPVAIPDMRAPLDAGQTALLDAAGALLAQSTADLVAAVRAAVAPRLVEALVLVFAPTILAPDMPELRRANLPSGWASPAFDRLQVEDYDWLTAGADAHRRHALAEIDARLGYPPQQQDYLAGFVPAAGQSELWRRIDAGIDAARARDPHEIVVWALPQVARDGYVRLPPVSTHDPGSDPMQPFDDVPYPLALGRDATVVAEFSTSVSTTASGFERRNSLWSDARLRFDVGPGVRSEAELGALLAFFRARRGPARGFRLRDPGDFSSGGMTEAPSALDQHIGSGDGITAEFALTKRYGAGPEAQQRRITRPDPASVRVSIDGVPQAGNWHLRPAGIVAFDLPPPAGAIVRAGFLFDVPVRFAQDSLEISGAAFAAGEAPSVPLVEIREPS
ncbi:phage distal tail protein, Rcc01695 family [Novosphingobium soli]|uniref:TIGR02217 family protein n=1 Tax=Novosphingobium soli TaxID=574956 RepID=A0ABV6CRZ0_9SPHN